MEVLIEIIFGRIIVGIFGYYTLFVIFKVVRYKDGLSWLDEESKHEGDSFGKGCFVSIVGLISFFLIFLGIGYVVDYFYYLHPND